MGREESHRFGSQAFSRKYGKKLSSVNVQCVQMQRQKQRPDPMQGHSFQLSKGCLQQLERYEQLGSHCSQKEIMAQSLSGSLKDITGLVGNHRSQVLEIFPFW